MTRVPKTNAALEVAYEEVLVDHAESVCAFLQDGTHQLVFLVQAVHFHPPFRALGLVYDEISADEFLLVEGCQFLDLEAGLLVDEEDAGLELARVERLALGLAR